MSKPPTTQTSAALNPPQQISVEVPNTLIVQFKKTVPSAKQDEHVQAVRLKCREPTGTSRRFAGIEQVYSKCFLGYSGEFAPNVEKFIRSQSSLFDVIERSVTMRFSDVTYTMKDNPNNWGLAKISLTPEEFSNQATEKKYNTASLGKATNIHILDDGYTPATGEKDQLGDRLKNGSEVTKSEEGHGTAVADLAAGKDFGAAPEASVYIYKVCRKVYENLEQPELYKLHSKAFFGTIQEVKVPSIINCSFEVNMEKADSLEKSIAIASKEGFIVVVAAGNPDIRGTSQAEVTGEKAGGSVNLGPAGYPGVITVGAIGPDDKPMHIQNGDPVLGSNYGKLADIYAPGVDMPTNGTTGPVSGTSYAAPIVSGTVSVLQV
ncbi:hypothetical protein GALMADRAFT_277791 [Galerina marginata CBS 339.88]|uniref:Peptidase S8/S53 domain-containing protein n=1 Tax=Galerina marginata (strain CBS 339.88) TaxID=685588 RepID=A0A067T851_GALM3|nr:hypothetical protein GALMADRAFT_277791 [Galerina marginata CBS 339.88]